MPVVDSHNVIKSDIGDCELEGFADVIIKGFELCS